MFTRNTVLIILFIRYLKAAVPIDIVTEKTSETKLKQHVKIIPLIPEKEPLIPSINVRKMNTEINRFEKHLNNILTITDANTSKTEQKDFGNVTQDKIFKEIKDSILNVSGNVSKNKSDIIEIKSRRINKVANKSISNVDNKTKKSMKRTKGTRKSKSLKRSKVTKKSQINDSRIINVTQQIDLIKVTKPSRKQQLFIRRMKTLNREKRYIREPVIQPIKPQIHQKPVKGISDIDLQDGEEISVENKIQNGRRYHKYPLYYDEYGRPLHHAYHYDSEYVDYQPIPFPYFNKPQSKPISVSHGTGIGLNQMIPILASMVLGTSSLVGKRHQYQERPDWKEPY